MDNIILIGGGGHCNSVIDVIEAEGRFQIAGIVDQFLPIGSDVLGYKVVGKDDDLSRLVGVAKYALVTVGQIKSAELRVRLFDLAKNSGFTLPVIVSPRAYISKHTKIGNGTVVMHDVLINSNTEVGENCIINTKTLIEHDCIIGNNCHIATCVTINGGVKVQNNVFVGSGVIAKQCIEIQKNSFIKAGSIVK